AKRRTGKNIDTARSFCRVARRVTRPNQTLAAATAPPPGASLHHTFIIKILTFTTQHPGL
ncbi:hypothetical protein ACVGWW_06230, partial [Enterobacter hormaechei]